MAGWWRTQPAPPARGTEPDRWRVHAPLLSVPLVRGAEPYRWRVHAPLLSVPLVRGAEPYRWRVHAPLLSVPLVRGAEPYRWRVHAPLLSVPLVRGAEPPGQGRSACSQPTAMASISTRAPLGRAATCTVARAGGAVRN